MKYQINLDLNMYVHLTSRLKGIKSEAIRKLSNQSQNNFKHIASFFTPFKGYKCSKLFELTPKKRFLQEREKTNFKSLKFHKMTSYAFVALEKCKKIMQYGLK